MYKKLVFTHKMQALNRLKHRHQSESNPNHWISIRKYYSSINENVQGRTEPRQIHLSFVLYALSKEHKQRRRGTTNLSKFPKSSTSLSSPLPGLTSCWVRFNSLTNRSRISELLTHCGNNSCQIQIP